MEMIGSISGNDAAACVSLCILSFIASVIQGSTSLGDGIVLQITWGILQELLPYATTESRLGSDGMRVITVFMYLRLSIIPPYLLWQLWGAHKKRQQQAVRAQQEHRITQLTQVSDAGEADGPNSPVSSPVGSPNTPAPPASAPRIFSGRLFFLIAVPNLVWCIIGVFLLQNLKSKEIGFYCGAIFIFFSFMYLALKIWKASSARKTMPQWLQHLLSPNFFVEGSESKLTTHAQISAVFFFNLTGLMTTLSGIGGPPMMIFILLYEIPMHLTRFTFPIGTLIGACFRLFVSLFSGVMPFELWPFFVPALFAGIIGIKVGLKIGNVLSPSMYAASIFSLLILAGIVMLTSNLYITGPSLVLSLVGLLFKYYYWDPRNEMIMQPDRPLQSVEIVSVQKNGESTQSSQSLEGLSSNRSHHFEDLDRLSRHFENEVIEATF